MGANLSNSICGFSNRPKQGYGIKGFVPTSVIQGNPLFKWGLVFGRPFLLYHRSGFHFPQPRSQRFWGQDAHSIPKPWNRNQIGQKRFVRPIFRLPYSAPFSQSPSAPFFEAGFPRPIFRLPYSLFFGATPVVFVHPLRGSRGFHGGPDPSIRQPGVWDPGSKPGCLEGPKLIELERSGFSTKITGNHNLQGNVQVYSL